MGHDGSESPAWLSPSAWLFLSISPTPGCGEVVLRAPGARLVCRRAAGIGMVGHTGSGDCAIATRGALPRARATGVILGFVF